MCGIVGYVGVGTAVPVLLEGLRRLEYRGYDSSGLATINQGRLHLRKRAGRLQHLIENLQHQPAPGSLGISHTRWATHGPATDVNAHPHIGGDGLVAVVHNGVIENHAVLRRQLAQEGVSFRSDTDTEVIAQLLAHHLRRVVQSPVNGTTQSTDLILEAISQSLSLLKGTYGLAIISPLFPGLLIGARLSSPLAVGLGHNELFLASDPSALDGRIERVFFLQDHQFCLLRHDGWDLRDAARAKVIPDVRAHDWAVVDSGPGNFEHHMLKEIHEQPQVLENTLRGRLSEGDATACFAGLGLDSQRLRHVERIILTACGTSYHAGLVGEYLIEEFARIPVEVEYASEFRYRNSPISPNTIVLAITQSGETADTLAAVRESRRQGHPTLALCNVPGSSIAREADGCIYLHAGPEIGVASTKAFSNQVAVLALLALSLGRMRQLSAAQGARMLKELRAMPAAVRQALSCHDDVRRIAQKYAQVSNFLYLGRQYHFPVALEGALKLKEISYIHAEGYPAAEMKHGPIALVDAQTPSIFLMPRGPIYDKVMSNLEEVKARRGPVIAVACEGDTEAAGRADDILYVPQVPEYLQPLVSVVPLQLLAYHIALLRGCDVDKPRNLAKSVTVE